ncbi:40S ribosomal S4 [Pyrrhoderma noxium]|uniref:40S ribosomal S4 n=1 Tax=Pyrrhoderma noxium TaxID=2282107 RepID=A0A286UKY3_9AGAM|nr:40S ribosomal S4 [Pyrrhoderma noxium]
MEHPGQRTRPLPLAIKKLGDYKIHIPNSNTIDLANQNPIYAGGRYSANQESRSTFFNSVMLKVLLPGQAGSIKITLLSTSMDAIQKSKVYRYPGTLKSSELGSCPLEYTQFECLCVVSRCISAQNLQDLVKLAQHGPRTQKTLEAACRPLFLDVGQTQRYLRSPSISWSPQIARVAPLDHLPPQPSQVRFERSERTKPSPLVSWMSSPLKNQMNTSESFRKVAVGAKGVPYIVTHDGRTIRYPDPSIKVNDTIKLDLETGKIADFIKFDTGNMVMVTGGRNMGRAGVITHRERHDGGIDMVHVRDALDRTFVTRITNVFIVGEGTKSWVSLPKGKGIKLTISEERDQRRKRAAAE